MSKNQPLNGTIIHGNAKYPVRYFLDDEGGGQLGGLSPDNEFGLFIGDAEHSLLLVTGEVITITLGREESENQITFTVKKRS